MYAPWLLALEFANTVSQSEIQEMGARQVAGVRERRTAAAEVRALLEEHQRQLARWEGRVARQLEKIVALQRGGRTPNSSATPASAAPFSARSGTSPSVKSPLHTDASLGPFGVSACFDPKDRQHCTNHLRELHGLTVSRGGCQWRHVSKQLIPC